MFSSFLLNLSPLPPMYSLSHSFPVHIQILSPNSTHHLPFQLHHLPFQPLFSPCVLRVYELYVLVCLSAFVFHVLMYLFYSFLCNYCLCLYTLRAFVCVKTSGLFIYTPLFEKILVIPMFFLL